MEPIPSSSNKFTPLQLELLRIYSHNPSEEELIDIKGLLADYYAEKLVKKVDKAMKDNNITQEDLDKWLNEKS